MKLLPTAIILTVILGLLLPTVDALAGPTRPINATYFVLFSDTATGPGSARCAGVLFNDDAVVTTAVCANSGLPFVRVGYSTDDRSTGVTQIVNIYNHPGWSPNHANMGVDLAVVILQDQFDQVMIPVINSIPYDINDLGGIFTVLGAGNDGTGVTQTGLAAVNVPTQGFLGCFNAYRAAVPQLVLNEDIQFCAGVGDISTGPCPVGDQGAPLISRGATSANDVVFGLASFGGCAKPDNPFVYTRLSEFFDWIEGVVCTNSAKPFTDCPTPSPVVSATLPPSRAPTEMSTFFFSIISDTSTGPGTFRCGGVLVHDDIVVTSSTCIMNANFDQDSSFVRVGYTQDDVSVAVSNISMVTAFVDPLTPMQENLPGDLAVIKLSTAVNNVAFPILNENSAEPRDRNAVVHYVQAGSAADTGFVYGKPGFSGTFASSLVSGSSVTSQFETCNAQYVALPGYQADIDEGVQFCVAMGICDTGASGSPLFTVSGDTATLVGLASQGSCAAGTPADVWTKISTYSMWINARICDMAASPPASCS